MAKLTKAEQKALDDLIAKRDAEDDDQGDDDQGDDDDPGILVLRGRRADDFLSSVFGGKKTKRKAKGDGDGDDGDDGGDGDDGDGDGDGDDDQGDPPPARGHKYFRR